MSYYDCNIYQNDLNEAIKSVIGIEKLKNSSIMITGASGLIGSYIVDILMKYNKNDNANIKVYALGRSKTKLNNRFSDIKTDMLKYIEHDVNCEPDFDYKINYIIHAASNAYPAAFNNDPVGTILSNIQGTKLMLDYAKKHLADRFLFVSSGEVYGQGDILLDSFKEDYSGYVDIMQPRFCYPLSKRTAENLCYSYTKQFGLDTVIVRPCHSYGPNVSKSDNRASVQFVNNALKGEDIVMKSSGSQLRSYCYIADCASAILTVLINGKKCEAYNIANSNVKVTIAQFAQIVAKQSGNRVVFSVPNSLELEQQTPIAKQVLNAEKLENLGWRGRFGIEEGIKHTLSVLKES